MLDLFGVFSVLLLVLANAYFVAAEYALVTVRWTRIEELIERGHYAAGAVRWAIEHKDETIALLFIPPLLAFARLTRPLVVLMRASGNFVVRLMRLPPPSPEQAVHSVEELDMLVEETREAGVIPPDQASYVRNVFELSDKRVCDIMVPREKVVTLSLAASEDEVLATARDTAHTRMPVWEGDPNNIVG